MLPDNAQLRPPSEAPSKRHHPNRIPHIQKASKTRGEMPHLLRDGLGVILHLLVVALPSQVRRPGGWFGQPVGFELGYGPNSIRGGCVQLSFGPILW